MVGMCKGMWLRQGQRGHSTPLCLRSSFTSIPFQKRERCQKIYSIQTRLDSVLNSGSLTSFTSQVRTLCDLFAFIPFLDNYRNRKKSYPGKSRSTKGLTGHIYRAMGRWVGGCMEGRDTPCTTHYT